MSSEFILQIYLFVLFAYLLFESGLSWLNMRHVQQNATEPPDPVKDHIDIDTYRKSVEYTLVKQRFGMVSSLFSALLLLVFILRGAFGLLEETLMLAGLDGYVLGVLYVVSLTVIFSVLEAPFSLYSTFVIEERFGFNKMTLGLWVKDFVKGLVLSAVILSPILLGLFWFMDSAGEYWWIYGFAFVATVQFVLIYLYPVLIAPLFNQFTPLEEGELKEKIYSLAEKIGFRTSGIFVMDGSKRSSHGNAYFTGFGSNKRIVLFDTLVDQLSQDQAVAVLAHEMGHEKKHHIKKSLALSLVVTLVGFWFLSLLVGYPPFFEAFGFTGVSNHGALIIFAFASSPVTYYLSPLFNMLSRRFEYEADRFAVNAVKGPGDLIEALVGLSKKNLSNLTPHPLYSFFHYSHPTLLERLSAMRA